jgi:16S rRNA (uracil1498-N3)-methyltransferase
MRVTRVHVASGLCERSPAVLTGPAAGHVRRVLRLRAGDHVTLFNGDGWDYPGRIVALRGDRVELELEGRIGAASESPLSITLAQGVARGERMDIVLQKATELGVMRIVPVLTERSVVRLDPDRTERRLAHWRAVVIAACEQSGRARVPEVTPPQPLARWLEEPAEDAARFLLWSRADRALAAAVDAPGQVTVLVGPEGGLTDAERGAAMAAGFDARSLGPRILRTETAALAALAVLQSVAGDLAAEPA